MLDLKDKYFGDRWPSVEARDKAIEAIRQVALEGRLYSGGFRFCEKRCSMGVIMDIMPLKGISVGIKYEIIRVNDTVFQKTGGDQWQTFLAVEKAILSQPVREKPKSSIK